VLFSKGILIILRTNISRGCGTNIK